MGMGTPSFYEKRDAETYMNSYSIDKIPSDDFSINRTYKQLLGIVMMHMQGHNVTALLQLAH